MTPSLDAATGALQYSAAFDMTRAATYKVVPLIGGQLAGTLDSAAPFLYSVLPDVPAALQSPLLASGVLLPLCPARYRCLTS